MRLMEVENSASSGEERTPSGNFSKARVKIVASDVWVPARYDFGVEFVAGGIFLLLAPGLPRASTVSPRRDQVSSCF